MKMLRHFKADFGIVHDMDWPRRKNGSSNAMWTLNTSIRDEIIRCRQQGQIVYHLWSIPDLAGMSSETISLTRRLTAQISMKL
jgi:putative ATP-dependent endonuclease of the OLD family